MSSSCAWGEPQKVLGLAGHQSNAKRAECEYTDGILPGPQAATLWRHTLYLRILTPCCAVRSITVD